MRRIPNRRPRTASWARTTVLAGVLLGGLLAPLLALGGCATSGASSAPKATSQANSTGHLTGIHRLDGSTIDPATLTARIEELTQAAEVHGLIVAVFNDREAVYSRAFGYADRPNEETLETDTEFYGASLSKAVFSVLVMKLVDQGVLDLDTPLQDYVDEPLWKNQGKGWHEDLSALENEPRYRKITARMSLSHTTGLPNWRWFEPDQTLRIHFEPGERYSYSGEGMTFLQIVLRKITGKPLEQLMQEEFFFNYWLTT